MVEVAFRPKDEEPKSLLHFVDEQSVETMRDSLKESIREAKVLDSALRKGVYLTVLQEAQTDFDTSILSFDDDLRALKANMKSSPKNSKSEIEISSPIPEHLHALEVNAQEMAHLLESLVRHFDLCVNAVRHTEGGYAAVRKAASSQPPDAEHVSVSGVMATEHDSAVEEALSDEERKEMLDVLEKDAAQVEDVVMELREFLDEMEARQASILEHVAALNTTYIETTTAYAILEGVSARLIGYIIAGQDFRARWEETKVNIQEQLANLEDMRLFYENYYSSYDGLILEVFRRKQSEEKVKAIMRKAMEQVEKVYEADARQREEFRIDVGEFLPADLWLNAHTAAPKWGFALADDEANVENLIPELDKAVVEAARRRDRERQKVDRER